MTKKKKKKRILKIKNIMILLGIFIIIGLFIYYVINMPIKNIYIKGNNIVSDNEIINSVNLDEYPSFLLTNRFELEKKLKSNNYIKNVDISKRLGNVIEIEVNEYRVICTNNVGKIILENGNILENTYDLSDVPILINDINDNSILNNFTEKFSSVDTDILRQISQIEYSPVEVDKDRFLLYMNDGNLVYITLTKVHKLNKYNKIKDKLDGHIGIIYLDSGDYVEIKK